MQDTNSFLCKIDVFSCLFRCPISDNRRILVFCLRSSFPEPPKKWESNERKRKIQSTSSTSVVVVVAVTRFPFKVLVFGRSAWWWWCAGAAAKLRTNFLGKICCSNLSGVKSVCLLQQWRLDRSGKIKMKEAGRREAVLCNKNNNRDAANYSSWRRSIDCPNNNNNNCSNNKKPYRWPLTTLEKVKKFADLKVLRSQQCWPLECSILMQYMAIARSDSCV